MNKQEREEIVAAISQAFDDPYPPELAPPMVGRIAWRKQHVLEAVKQVEINAAARAVLEALDKL